MEEWIELSFVRAGNHRLFGLAKELCERHLKL